ncbi:hypothetical protein F5884DRAFT_790745 [Xylogone sp. PMI_703]|nr:hypothetical protein F5884DRAFT_790745 [Xylogone sp. PMI_703]
MARLIYSPMPPAPGPTISLHDLDAVHFEPVQRALLAILALDITVDAFAQIIDGLPTRSTFGRHFREPPHLPEILRREEPEAKSIKLYEDFKKNLDISTLHLDAKIIQAYQNAPLNSPQFELRLLEVVAIAVHTLGGAVYHANYPEVEIHPRWQQPGPDFYHRCYMGCLQYPYGILNMIGYWLESQVFGGVILGEHDAAESEVVYTHLPVSLRTD